MWSSLATITWPVLIWPWERSIIRPDLYSCRRPSGNASCSILNRAVAHWYITCFPCRRSQIQFLICLKAEKGSGVKSWIDAFHRYWQYRASWSGGQSYLLWYNFPVESMRFQTVLGYHLTCYFLIYLDLDQWFSEAVLFGASNLGLLNWKLIFRTLQ